MGRDGQEWKVHGESRVQCVANELMQLCSVLVTRQHVTSQAGIQMLGHVQISYIVHEVHAASFIQLLMYPGQTFLGVCQAFEAAISHEHCWELHEAFASKMHPTWVL